MPNIFHNSLSLGYPVAAGASYPTSNLISYWRFDETSGTSVADQYGSNTGIASNAAIWNSSGKNNGCAYPNNTYSINFGNSGDFNIGSGSMSWSFWIYGIQEYNPQTAILSKTNGDRASTTYGWFLASHHHQGMNGVGIIMSSSSAGWFTGAIPNTEVTDNQWNHYAFTLNGRSSNSDFKGYLNGVEKKLNYGGDITIHTNVTNTLNLVLSGESDGGDKMRAKIDELGIWKRVLTPTEVSTIYNNGAGLFL